MNEIHKFFHDKVKDLIQQGREAFYLPEWRSQISDEEVLGVIIAKYCEWTGDRILKTFSSALEDANYHTLSAKVDKWISSKANQKLLDTAFEDILNMQVGDFYDIKLKDTKIKLHRVE